MSVKKISYITTILVSTFVISCAGNDIVPKPDDNQSNPAPPTMEEIQYPEASDEVRTVFTAKTYNPIKVKQLKPSQPPHNWDKANTRNTRVIHYMNGYTPEYTTQEEYQATVNEYGSSLLLPRQDGTGRFRVEKINGRWWIVDPDGYLNIYRGVTSLGIVAGTESTMTSMFGSKEAWVTKTWNQLQTMGFSGVGGFSDHDQITQYNISNPTTPIIHTPIITHFISSVMAKKGLSYPDTDTKENNRNCMAGFIFLEDFPEMCMEVAAENLAKYKGDKTVFGVMSDNEIIFSANSVDIMAELLRVKDDDFVGKKEAQKVLVENGLEPTVEAYLDSPEHDELQDILSGRMAERYYKACRDAIKAVDPDMLYLGSRLHGYPKSQKSVIQAAGKYCDVITINYYGDWEPEQAKNWAEWTDTPIMVTEFYSMADDTGLTNPSGAGFLVQTTLEKGFFYQHFILGLLEMKNCIGWTWFRYIDSGQGSNGIYNSRFGIYPELYPLVRELNFNAYDLINYFDN